MTQPPRRVRVTRTQRHAPSDHPRTVREEIAGQSRLGTTYVSSLMRAQLHLTLGILAFGVLVPVFATSGRVSPGLDFDFRTQFYLFEALARGRLDVWWNLITHNVLPAFALSIPLGAIIATLLKQSLKETMHLDYVTLARTKGYGEARVITREALPNAILPTLTLIGVQFTFLIGGTVIIERLFSYEGLGNMAIDAVINRDLPLIQGIVLTFALIFTLVNLAVDLTYAALNPRLRHG